MFKKQVTVLNRLISWVISANLILFSFSLLSKTLVDTKNSLVEIEKIDFSRDERTLKLSVYLTKLNSPLASYAPVFVEMADKYGVDYRLVASISGVESTFAKHYPKGSYNAYGWSNGDYKFQSWEHSIEHITQYMAKEYVAKGFDTIPEIAKKYAPPSKTWASGVTFFMNKIEQVQVKSS